MWVGRAPGNLFLLLFCFKLEAPAETEVTDKINTSEESKVALLLLYYNKRVLPIAQVTL